MRHGGDLDEATRLYGNPPEGWLDLSTGVNPRPYGFANDTRVRTSLRSLPSPRQLDELLSAARQAYSVPDCAALVAAPGTEILIRALPRLVNGGLAVIRTSYGSYREIWPEAAIVAPGGLPDLMMEPEASVLVVSPNNPDGRVANPTLLLHVARSRSPGHVLIVDEAYADCCDHAGTVLPLMQADDPILVLRSFGKFYGLPGLRLGFAIGPDRLIQRLADQLGDWPVSGPALAIGREALTDDSWRGETRHWLGNQAQALDAVLLGGGLRLAGGCPLFRAAETEDAPGVHDRLARSGIWTRIFDDWPSLIRFGLPPDRGGLMRLADALAGH